MWLIIIIVAIVVVVSVILVYLAVKTCCKFGENKEQDHVSLSFPLPPPTGESDDMDDTQYDITVRAFREPEYGEGGDGLVEKKEDYLPSVPHHQGNKPKLLMEEQTQSNKVPCFLFEAPPPYEEVEGAAAQSGERRRMVSIKMPDLPIRKVGDTQILDRSMAPTQSLSVTTRTAVSTSRTTTQPQLNDLCVTQENGTPMVEGSKPLHPPAVVHSTRTLPGKPVKSEGGKHDERPTLKISKPGGEEGENSSTPIQSLKDAEIQDAHKKS